MVDRVIPNGAEDLPGVVGAYEAYHDAIEAIEAEGSERSAEAIAARNDAAQALDEKRSYWRNIRSYIAGENVSPQVAAGVSVPGPDVKIEES